MQGMSQFEREAFGLAARSELRNMMGRAATNFGPSGDRAARRALNSEFNRANVQQIAGPQPAARIADRIDAENTFAETANQAMGNSATARRQATRDMIPASMTQLPCVNCEEPPYRVWQWKPWGALSTWQPQARSMPATAQ